MVAAPDKSCRIRRRAVTPHAGRYRACMQTRPTLPGAAVLLRPATPADVPALAGIRATPEVRARWRGGPDMVAEVRSDLADERTPVLAVEYRGRVVGAIQWHEEDEPDYRHAGIDVYLDPAVHGRGLGTDAVRTLARYLVTELGHHRLVIDPAADNAPAIACYRKVGFRPVGVMRQYERGADGTWHDGLLMDLLAGELAPADGPSSGRRRTAARAALRRLRLRRRARG
ncbi:hypothetical protein GCM10009663_03780 [Kitasatospora arboriphila]|uniref:N-acetyltransferase domain-containing protein n=1 Tax=Kitasatospora arboriphila TaxID=258052 RepID=A0ABN1TAA1_9ACTN